LILKELKLEKGSAEPNRVKVGKITKDQIKRIAELKMKDLNASSVESAMSMVAGTARSMGILVEG
jgi:large subunit ribosomal protein L11